MHWFFLLLLPDPGWCCCWGYFKNYGKFKTLLASLFGDSSSSALQCSSSFCRFGESFYSQAGCKLVDNCMFLREIFYMIYLPWIRYLLKILVLSLRTSQLSWHWTKLVLFNRQPLPTCCGTLATATSTTCRARSPCPSLAMPSCLPSPRRRSSRWVNIDVRNAWNLVHIHFVFRCSQRQSHNMDPSYVSILVTGQMPFSQHQRWSEPLCFLWKFLIDSSFSPSSGVWEGVVKQRAHHEGSRLSPPAPMVGHRPSN